MTATKKYNKSQIFKYAFSLLNAIPMESRLNNTWSDCLKQSWHIAKNGSNTMTFNQIYSKYYKQIYYYVLKQVFNKTEIAEELTQETFVKFANCEYDVYKAKITTLLYTIAKNLIIDYIRANAKYSNNLNVSDFVDSEGNEFFQIETSADYEADYDNNNSELSQEMLKAFRTLKPKYRKIAVLYFLREKQYSEIAEICNVPMGTVQGMIFRIRTMLQKQLNNYILVNV